MHRMRDGERPFEWKRFLNADEKPVDKSFAVLLCEKRFGLH
jgi:hypothetical protein